MPRRRLPPGGQDRGRPVNRARKRLGQHFLTDRNVLTRIADALDPGKHDTVVEIGPGRGSLTDILVERAGRVVAVELDRELAPLLRERYAQRDHVAIVEADVLDVRFGDLGGPGYLLVGNVPYYITTPILFRALESPRPARAVFLVQREVAERVVAAPGSKIYGALSVNVQGFADAELIGRVAPGAFRPPPTVDSAILRVTPRERSVVGPHEEARYRVLVQQAFGFRRKQMRRVVRSVAALGTDAAERALEQAGIVPEARPEALTPEDFARLLNALRDEGPGTRDA